MKSLIAIERRMVKSTMKAAKISIISKCILWNLGKGIFY